MKQPVDSLFNKKLKNHSGQAPAAAWDRIDANLSQKKKPFVWMKVAASLALIAVAGFVAYTTFEKPVAPIAEIKKETPAVEKGVGNEIAKPTEEPVIEKVPEVEPKKELPQNSVAKVSNKKKETQKITHQPIEEPIEFNSTTTVAVVEPTIDFTNTISENPIETITETEPQNTTILISAEEANAKYLNQQYIADATPENKKSSKIRNLFEKAQDMDPIGEIRQLKNEVLALNFRNEKKGERNK